MLVQRARQEKGFLSKGHKPAVTLRLPGALSLSGSGPDGRSGIPRRCSPGPLKKLKQEFNREFTLEKGKTTPSAPKPGQVRLRKSKAKETGMEVSPEEFPKQAGAKATVPAHLARAVATAPIVFRLPTNTT